VGVYLADGMLVGHPVLRASSQTARSSTLQMQESSAVVLAPPAASLPSLQPLGSSLAPARTLRPPQPTADVIVRGARTGDLPALAQLCTDAFYGEHALQDGPVIFLQRLVILARVRRQVKRRLSFEDGRECRVLVAEERESGELRGCVDLAVHAYDRLEQCFLLTEEELPADARYCWRPYIASLAVSRPYRRRGIARELMHEAEHLARRWGHSEVLLEVAMTNLDSIRFYEALDYRMLRQQTAGIATQVDVRHFWWEKYSVGKYIMAKRL